MKLFKSVDSEMESVEGIIEDNLTNRWFIWYGKKITEHPVIGLLCTYIIPSIIGGLIGLYIRKRMKCSDND